MAKSNEKKREEREGKSSTREKTNSFGKLKENGRGSLLVKILFVRGGPEKLRSFWERKAYAVLKVKDQNG